MQQLRKSTKHARISRVLSDILIRNVSDSKKYDRVLFFFYQPCVKRHSAIQEYLHVLVSILYSVVRKQIGNECDRSAIV